MAAKITNAQQELERLLSTSTAPGPYCMNGCFPSDAGLVPQIRLVGDDTTPIKLPLDDAGAARIKKFAERAEIGTADGAVVNLEARTSWQLLPDKISVNTTNFLDQAVEHVSKGLGLKTDYSTVKANLYKLLLYEPGCFFKRHQDTERLHGMFGTLIIELPSIYQGAKLTVYSPSNPSEKMSFGFGSDALMHYTAFYADCFHEVSKLTSGYRVALVYHLTAAPKTTKLLPHLPDPAPTPPQPASEDIVQSIADTMYTFSLETEEDDYPKVVTKREMYGSSYEETRGGVKPSKLALVLSHHYTPASLESDGVDALKGTDCAIAELIRAAAWCRPTKLPPSDVEESPYFDAMLSLAVLFDQGECTPIDDHGFRTTGRLIPLAMKSLAVPLRLGPPIDGDVNAEYEPSWFDTNSSSFFPPWDDEEEMPPANWEQIWTPPKCPDRCGNHSLPIFAEELLFASESAKDFFNRENMSYGDEKRNQNVLVHSDPKEVEFLGNGMPYPGRWYSRSVILLWPQKNREIIELQSKGGRAMKQKSSKKQKRGGPKKQKRSA